MIRFLVALALTLPLLGSHAEAVGAQASTAEANVLRFVVVGLEVEAGGVVRCALYRDEDTWLDKRRRFRHAAARVQRSSAACVFRDIPPGSYAIAALHDEDGDREMDTSAFGVPREGYAISRNEIDRMSAPDWDEAVIQFDGGRMTTRARMNY